MLSFTYWNSKIYLQKIIYIDKFYVSLFIYVLSLKAPRMYKIIAHGWVSYGGKLIWLTFHTLTYLSILIARGKLQSFRSYSNHLSFLKSIFYFLNIKFFYVFIQNWIYTYSTPTYLNYLAWNSILSTDYLICK